ncbi:MAG: hypothetical protein ACRENY_00800 [Candidatus Dormibacteria bacterium]
MRSSQWASALLATIAMGLVISACGGGGSSPPTGGATCTGSGHSVELVAELGDHKVVDRCVPFSGTEISGETALRKSGIEFASQHFSYGDALCQIDHEPRSYTSCFPSGAPYWALFVWSAGKWKSSSTGISDVKLTPGEAEGLRYDPSSGTAAPPPAPPKS